MDLLVDAPNPTDSALFSGTPFLVASDLCGARSLVAQVVAEAKAHRAQVALLQVLYGAQGAGIDAGGGPSQPAESGSDPELSFSLTEIKRLRDARLALLGVAREIEAQGVPCTSAVRRGEAAAVLAEAVNRLRPVRGPVLAPGASLSEHGAAAGIAHARSSAVLIYLQGDPGKAA